MISHEAGTISEITAIKVQNSTFPTRYPCGLPQ